MSLYDTPGAAATYRATRALPADTVQVWVHAIREAVRHLSVRRAVDVIVMSLSYHQLRDAKTARAEFLRALHPGGAVLLRTPTHETLGRCQWTPFFPESVAIDLARMPTHDQAVAAFRESGFVCPRSTMVWQRIAASVGEYATRIGARAFSAMQALPDDVWARRLAAFEEHCRTAPDGPIDEPVHLFLFEIGGPDMAPKPPDVRSIPA